MLIIYTHAVDFTPFEQVGKLNQLCTRLISHNLSVSEMLCVQLQCSKRVEINSTLVLSTAVVSDFKCSRGPRFKYVILCSHIPFCEREVLVSCPACMHLP